MRPAGKEGRGGARGAPRRGRTIACALGAGLVLAGCSSAPPPPPPLAPPGTLPRLAILPFENLTARGEAGTLFTRIFFSEVYRLNRYEVVESGEVERVLDDLRLPPTGSLSNEQLRTLGERLHVQRVLVGSVLEASLVPTGSGGEVGSVGATVKLLDVAQERVVWTRIGFKTGEDKETVFGWGRERSAEKLAAELAMELVSDLPSPGGASEIRRPPPPPARAAADTSAAPAAPDSGQTKEEPK
jgi:hypothetical protein